MLFEGSFQVAASRKKVAEFFSQVGNMSCIIPGCIEQLPEGPDRTTMVIEQKVAFLKGRFTVNMRVVENRLPEEITAEAYGKDARIGSNFKIGAALWLEETASGVTTIRYRMEVSVFGKLGNLGFFVIKAKASEMEQEFIAAATAILEGRTQDNGNHAAVV